MTNPSDDLDRDIRDHIDFETRDNIDRGMAPEDARFAALRKFGNIGRIKEDTRGVWTWAWLGSLLQDVRYAIRGFLRAPAFALTVIVTIGLALGLNTTLFTIFNAYVLKPFAVRDPYSLYRFTWSTKKESYHVITLKDLDDFLRAPHAVLSDALAMSLVLTRAGGSQVVGEQVSGNYFRMLGVTTELGRTLEEGDSYTLVLSDGAWKTKFGGDPNILGRKLRLLGGSYEVVGVMRPEFSGTSQAVADIWIPMIRSGTDAAAQVKIIARLKPGVSPKQAQAELLVWARQETADKPEAEHARGVEMESAATSIHLTPQILAAFSPILAAFGLVLVIACANVANIMLARAMARQREIGVRLSLGAGRIRLIRQLLTESLMLALPAALAGLVVSQVALRGAERLMVATAPPVWLQLIHFFKLETDYRVFLFILLAAVVSTLFFGLAPAIQATRPGISYAARGDFSADVRPARLRNALVIGQVTVCVLLLICSGILLRTGHRMERADVGMDLTNVLDLKFRFRKGDIDPKLVERLKQEPGVVGVATVWRSPLYGSLWRIPVAPGKAPDFTRAGYGFISPGYFDVLRVPLTRGRNFTEEESRGEAAVTIISELTAARFWPGEDPLGKTVRLNPDRNPNEWRKMPAFNSAVVIGVARDVMNGGPNDGLDPSCFYFPTGPQGAKNESLLIRVVNESEAMRRTLDNAMASVASDSVSFMLPMDQALALQIYPFQVSAWIGSFLGALALVLTLTGIYGVLSYLVSQRTKEIGIRMALGASATGVIRLVLSQSLKLAGIGVAIGVMLALGVSRIFASEMEAINTFDAFAYAGGIAVAMGAAAAAAYFPSKRAAAIDPTLALRCD